MGIVPDLWYHGVIMPLYKSKGTSDDPNNYRGHYSLYVFIQQLLDICTMIQGSVMNKQAFDPNSMGHIFTLHAIIEYYKSKTGRVYCVIIDYNKAFDLIDIMESIVNFYVIYNMYSTAKSCVKSNDKISSLFSCNIRVKQGKFFWFFLLSS